MHPSDGINSNICMILHFHASRPGHTKDHDKNGTVYGDMHLKDLLGSIVRVGYRITVYLVLHGLRCRKSTKMD